jgi:hypothetical protein
VPGISAFPVNYQAAIVVELWQALPKVPQKSDLTFFFVGSVLVFGREQLPL